VASRCECRDEPSGSWATELGRAMAQAVSRRPFAAEARVLALANPCGIYGGESGTGIGFSPSYSGFPCKYHSTVALQTHIIQGMNNKSVVAVQRRSLTPSKSTM
jgi:hypothetical protein